MSEQMEWMLVTNGGSTALSRMARIDCNGKPVIGWCWCGIEGLEATLIEIVAAHNATLRK